MVDQQMTEPPLEKRMADAGYRITVRTDNDRMGTYNIVTVSREKKRTRRSARKYADALAQCAEAVGVAP